MKKLVLFLIILYYLSSGYLIAQRQGISIGGNVYFPVGDWAEVAELAMEVQQLMNIH